MKKEKLDDWKHFLLEFTILYYFTHFLETKIKKKHTHKMFTECGT